MDFDNFQDSIAGVLILIFLPFIVLYKFIKGQLPKVGKGQPESNGKNRK